MAVTETQVTSINVLNILAKYFTDSKGAPEVWRALEGTGRRKKWETSNSESDKIEGKL